MNIAIIGAGATGLTAGYKLSEQGHNVTVFERDNEPGGLVSTLSVGKETLEKFYHHIFTSDTEVVDLIQELGLTPRLKWLPSKSGIYIHDKLYPFSTPMDLLTFKELPFISRVLMGMLLYRARFVKDWRSLEDTSAKEWIIKNAGKQVYEKVWGPLLNSKFDVDADKISAVWIWNKFKLRGSTREKGLNKEYLGYMEGSFGQIFETLAEKIKIKGGNILYSTPVEKIAPMQDHTVAITANGKTSAFDRVIVTTAPAVLTELMPALPAAYRSKINEIKYKSNICMILELDQMLSPYYWITIADPTLPFVLAIEHTNLVSTDGYESHIVYLSRYLDETHPLFSKADDVIQSEFVQGLKKIFPSFAEESIKRTQVFRSKYAQPVVGKKYSNILPEFGTPAENVFLANMSQIYPEDRGQNYSIRLGRHIAEIVNDSTRDSK